MFTSSSSMSSSFKAFSQLEKPRLASKKAIQKITQDIYLPSENTLECRALKIPLLSRTHFRHTLPQRPRLSPQPSSRPSSSSLAPSPPPILPMLQHRSLTYWTTWPVESDPQVNTQSQKKQNILHHENWTTYMRGHFPLTQTRVQD